MLGSVLNEGMKSLIPRLLRCSRLVTCTRALVSISFLPQSFQLLFHYFLIVNCSFFNHVSILWFLPCSWNIFLVVNCFSCLLQWSIVTVFDCHFDYPSVSFTLSLWSRIAKGPDRSTKPLARFFACSLAPLTHSLALHCLLCLRAMLHSLARLLAHFTHFLACGKVNN